MWLQNSEYLDETTFISSCATLFILASFMIFSLVFVKKRIATLQNKEIMEKWSNFYQDIHLTRNEYTILYYSIFLFRRIVFVAVPFCLYNWPFLQLQLLMLSQTAYVIFYSDQRPHTLPKRIKLEVFNEIIIMIIIYHLFLFSDFNSSLELQF